MIKVALTNLGKYNEGNLIYEWLEIPFSDEELKEAMKKIGINEEYEEFFISDYETDINSLKIGEYENLEELNKLSEQLENLQDYEIKKIEAILEFEEATLNYALENIENYELYEEINDDEELGYMYGADMIPKDMEHFENYIDWERYGRDIRLEEGGYFSKNGYIFRY